MWRRAYFLLILVRIYFALSPSYLHPDENFQGPEVIAGKPANFLHCHWTALTRFSNQGAFSLTLFISLGSSPLMLPSVARSRYGLPMVRPCTYSDGYVRDLDTMRSRHL